VKSPVFRQYSEQIISREAVLVHHVDRERLLSRRGPDSTLMLVLFGRKLGAHDPESHIAPSQLAMHGS